MRVGTATTSRIAVGCANRVSGPNRDRYRETLPSSSAASGARAAIGLTVCGAVDPAVELGSLICFDDLHYTSNRLPGGELCTFYDR